MRDWSALAIALMLQPVTWFLWAIAAEVNEPAVGLLALLFLLGAVWVSMFSVKAMAVVRDVGFDAPSNAPGSDGDGVMFSRFWGIRIVHAIGALFLITHLSDNGIRDWAPMGLVAVLMWFALGLQFACAIMAKPMALRLNAGRVTA